MVMVLVRVSSNINPRPFHKVHVNLEGVILYRYNNMVSGYTI